MRKITIISALVACSVLGATQAYALDEDHISSGKPLVCPTMLQIPLEIAA